VNVKKEVWLTADESATLLDASSRTIQRRIKAEKYDAKTVKNIGGTQSLILLTSLPKEAQTRYQNQQLEKVTEQIESKNIAVNKAEALPVVIKTDLSELTDGQREIDRSIEIIFRCIAEFKTEAAALRHINTGYEIGTLPSSLIVALDHAKEKKRKNSTLILARRTVANWKKRKLQTGSYAPLKREVDMAVKPWHNMAIALYCRPQKPTFQYVVEKLAEHFQPPITYAQVRDFFVNKYSVDSLITSRHKGQQSRELKYYKKRTAAGMLPWDEVHADGWNTHFSAPHPVTGEYVTFEVWDLHDVATRYVPPFGIGLTENYEVIAKSFENAIRDYGVMAILMTDSTKIVKKNKRFTGNPVLSIADRAGITIVHPQIVGNAQANGISENFHTYLDRASRELSTYQHPKQMDALTFKRGKKLTAKLVRAKKADDKKAADKVRREINKNAAGILFESMDEMVGWLESVREKWNNHHHSALEKIIDDTTGKKRHMSPNEAIAKFKRLGWQPVTMEEPHLIDLFRPRVQRKVRRGIVAPYHKDVSFRNHELDHWEGKEVIISYDIMDYSQVWVFDLKGTLICVAKHDAAVSYRSEHAQSLAEEKRALATVKRKENQIVTTLKRAGLNQPHVIEGEAKVVVDFAIEQAEIEHQATILNLWGSADDDEPAIEKKTINFEE